MKTAIHIAAFLIPALFTWEARSSNFFGTTKGGETAGFVLKETQVFTEITGNTAHTEVMQTYANPFSEPIEGIYFFPLPESSAINRMVMLIGSRVIEADIKPKEEAEEIYETARDEGKHASLLEEQRDNIFKQSVANIMPGEEIKIYIRFVQPVLYDENVFSYRFPTVIGPRYFPEGYAIYNPDKTDVHPAYLNPGVETEKIKHRFQIDVLLRSGIDREFIKSPSHDIDIAENKAGGLYEYSISNDKADDRPDKDFVLEYKFPGDSIKTTLLTHKAAEDKNGYFMLVLYPPDLPDSGKVSPKEMFFVLDTSGSMSGAPIKTAKELMDASISNMNKQDSFQVYTFSNDVQAYFDQPVTWSKKNVEDAVSTIKKVSANGGTEMLGPFQTALGYPQDDGRLRIVFFLTDGYVGNEAEILSLIEASNEKSRIFPVGIGCAPNSYLIESIASVGRGKPFYFGQNGNGADLVKSFYDKISSPYLVDVRVEVKAKDVKLADMAPKYVPDLFAGSPLFVVGRYKGSGDGTIMVKGKVGGKPVTIPVTAAFPEKSLENSAIKYLWADKRIKELEAKEDLFSENHMEEIEKLALRYHLVSRYTSFVAVEKKVVNTSGSGDKLLKVFAKAHIPEGTKWEGFFGESQGVVLSANLSPDRIQPGDPEIVVKGGKTIKRVTSVLPWGETVRHVYVPQKDEFVGRFLVPDNVPEGKYDVKVFVELKGGDTKVTTVSYRVDRSEPELRLETEIKKGKLTIKAIPVNNVYEGKLVAVKNGIEIRKGLDIKYLKLTVNGAVHVPKHLEKQGYFRLVYKIPKNLAGGEVNIKLSAVDFADNTFTVTKTVSLP
ncbi:MAG: VIT domain-containing protein [Pseudomonadota bacterium]